MAGQSVKKQVTNNLKVLKETHIITAVIYISSLIARFYFKRPTNNKIFYLTSIPLFISLFIIEKTGRPLIINNKIIKEGQDLSQPGLVEYLFDVIYLTLFLNLVSILFNSNFIFWVYLAVPGFAGYKLYTLLQAGKAMFSPSTGNNTTTGNNTNNTNNTEKSKRQQKMEARGDKPKIRYR